MHSRKLKVAFPFVGDLIGGSHFSSHGLIKHLDLSEFDPLIMVDEIGNPIAKLMADLDTPIIAAPRATSLTHGKRLSFSDWFATLRSAPILAAFLRKQAIDVVHLNDGRTAAARGMSARLAGAKLIWHHRSGPDARGMRFASPLLAHAVISVSDFARGDKRSARKDFIIHSPFDTEIVVDRRDARHALVQEIGCPQSTRIVGFFGTLIARKRPFLFVEAIATLRRIAPSLSVIGVFFGDPVDISTEDVRRHAERHGVSDAIRIMGFRSLGATWIAACDVLAIPAVEKPFGRTIIEAMIVGTPVVATASGGNPDALERGRLGRLVAPDDPIALANGLAAALTRVDETARLASVAKDTVRRRFGEQQLASQVMTVYRGLFPKRQFTPPSLSLQGSR